MKKSGFTLIELLIVVFVVSIGLITIIQGMSQSQRYISETAQRTVALNLAKEGIEAVYNLRNTNRRRYSDKKNQCWLTRVVFSYSPEGCQTYDWLREGDIFKLGLSNEDLSLPYTHISLSDWSDTDARFSNMTTKPYQDEYFRLYPYSGQWVSLGDISSGDQNRVKNTTSQGEYYRVISIHSLVDKENGASLDYVCTKGEDSWGIVGGTCGDNHAMELRFCSTVFYRRPYQGVVNLCAIMTNFQK